MVLDCECCVENGWVGAWWVGGCLVGGWVPGWLCGVCVCVRERGKGGGEREEERDEAREEEMGDTRSSGVLGGHWATHCLALG